LKRGASVFRMGLAFGRYFFLRRWGTMIFLSSSFTDGVLHGGLWGNGSHVLPNTGGILLFTWQPVLLPWGTPILFDSLFFALPWGLFLSGPGSEISFTPLGRKYFYFFGSCDWWGPDVLSSALCFFSRLCFFTAAWVKETEPLLQRGERC